jgi:hypothetical protein
VSGGTQYVFNCGPRSVKELMAIQEQAIKYQHERENKPTPQETPSSTVKPTRKARTKKPIEAEEPQKDC